MNSYSQIFSSMAGKSQMPERAAGRWAWRCERWLLTIAVLVDFVGDLEANRYFFPRPRVSNFLMFQGAWFFAVSGAWREASQQAVALRWAALVAGSSQKAKQVWEAGVSVFHCFLPSFLFFFLLRCSNMSQWIIGFGAHKSRSLVTVWFLSTG